MTMTADPGGQVLHGDWRRRAGTGTDAHLWREGGDYALPACLKNIEWFRTSSVHRGRPCTDCLVAEITRTTSR
jgi:hypothetical protein